MTTTADHVTLPPGLLDEIEEHAFSVVDREVGGILVGRLVDGAANITGFVPALKAESSTANVTFTHDVWAEVLEQVDEEHSDAGIVGWYHTHPGFGVFLSEYDRFIQRNFFPDERMVALVVDPVAGQVGWFGWCDGEIELVGQYDTTRPAVQRPEVAENGKSATRSARGRVALYAVALALVAGVGGYWLGSRTPVPQPGSTTLSEKQATIDRLEAELADARSQVSPETPSASPHQAAVIYRIQPGDSWWRIAAAFYGDGDRYPVLQRANPKTTMDPGERLMIPDQRDTDR